MKWRRGFASAVLSALCAGGAWACPEPGGTYVVSRPADLADDQTSLYLGSNPGFGTTPILSKSTSDVEFQVPVSGYMESFEVYYLYFPTNANVVFTLLGAYTTCDDPATVDPGGVGSGGVDTTPIVPVTPAIGSTGPTSLSSARDAFRAAQSGRPLVRATSSQVAAPSGAPEILLTGRTAQITKARALVNEVGGTVLRTRSLGGLGVEMVSVDLLGLLAIDAFQVKLAQSGIEVSTGANSLYRASNTRSYANNMVGGLGWEGCILPSGLRIGLIDGPVDLSAPALQNVPILTNDFLGQGDRSGTVNHATELASLIAGQATDNTPAGLARGAQLFAAVAFMRKNGRNVASLEHLAASLDWMVSMRVPLVNMSLAGPQNETLTDVVSMVAKQGVIIVASTGNDGRGVAFPAADPNVIAVTAVDAAGHLFGEANRGPQVDFAAPGVDILVPQKRGKAFRSGTSYSAAIATGIIAHELAHGPLSRAALVTRLRSHTKDLGPKGKDAQFGYGLMALTQCKN